MDDKDLDALYEKLMEGQQYLDLMYLPSGAIAWLFDQPEQQVQTAMQLAKESHLADNSVVNATLLQDDQLIIIMELASGRKIRIYPDGGLSSDGQPYDLGDLVTLIADDIPGVEQGMGPEIGDSGMMGMGPPGAVDPMDPVGEPPMEPGMPPEAPGGAPDSVVVAPPGMSEPPMEPGPEDALGMEDDLIGDMGVKPLSDLM